MKRKGGIEKKILLLAIFVLLVAYASAGFPEKQKSQGVLKQELQVNLDIQKQGNSNIINLAVNCKSSYTPLSKITGKIFGISPCED
tara:strand:- start:1070 stop:1327 length:258 start_codon:yes stop_codon:yes gene_type:complete